MPETILTLLGGGLGGVLRLVPELIKLFTDKRDRDHEYRMTELQFQIDQARAEQQLDLVHATGEMDAIAGEMGALQAAIEAQGRLTGIGWADKLSSSVRPIVTYWWLALFTIYKISAITQVWAYSESLMIESFIEALWTNNDAGILSMILSFWFVDRVIRKHQGN